MNIEEQTPNWLSSADLAKIIKHKPTDVLIMLEFLANDMPGAIEKKQCPKSNRKIYCLHKRYLQDFTNLFEGYLWKPAEILAKDYILAKTEDIQNDLIDAQKKQLCYVKPAPLSDNKILGLHIGYLYRFCEKYGLWPTPIKQQTTEWKTPEFLSSKYLNATPKKILSAMNKYEQMMPYAIQVRKNFLTGQDNFCLDKRFLHEFSKTTKIEEKHR